MGESIDSRGPGCHIAEVSVDRARAAQAIEAFLSALGHPPDKDPELAETGVRVAEAFADELLAGYRMNPAKILEETCAAEAESGGVVMLANVHTTVMCPHHLLPATGVVHVGYLPGDDLVGLGALGRLVQCHARRLALQEDVCRDVARSLVLHAGARAAGCMADLAPSCVRARGDRQAEARSVTMAWAGDADADFRAAFLAQLPGRRA